MKRTKATIKARTAAESKGLSLEGLANDAIKNGKFPKYGIGGNYSFSWINSKLRAKDDGVATKLVEHAKTINTL